MTDPAPPARVVTLGECLVALVAQERGAYSEGSAFRLLVAGAEANVAVGLARLDVPVAYIGRVGDDSPGSVIRRRLRGEGVDVTHLRTDPEAPTGALLRELRDVGPSEVIYWRAGSAGSRLSTSDVQGAEEDIRAAAWLHVTGITPALSATAAAAVGSAVSLAREVGATVSMDINLRRRLWADRQAREALQPLLRRCHVVLGSPDELAVVAGLAPGSASDPAALAEAVLSLGPERVIAKLGDQGAFMREHTPHGDVDASVPALPVARVVDPVGAGDAFCAGYIAACLDGAAASEALAAAVACGAAVVATAGDQAGLLTTRELRALLAGGGPDTVR